MQDQPSIIWKNAKVKNDLKRRIVTNIPTNQGQGDVIVKYDSLSTRHCQNLIK